jgi:hypothetical protein
MRVPMRGKMRARRLVIANAKYDPPNHPGIGHVDPGRSGPFLLIPADAGIPFLLNKPSISSCVPAFAGMLGDERTTR